MTKDQVITRFCKISGISNAKAEQLYKKGARTRSDLKNKKYFTKLSKLSKWDLTYNINKKIKLSDAQNLFKFMKYYRNNKSNKFEIVASVAAKKKFSEDLDIITTYPLYKLYFKYNKFFVVIDKIGKKLKQTLLIAYSKTGKINYDNSYNSLTLPNNIQYIKVDLFKTTDSEYVFAKFQYTASKQYNIIIRKYAKNRGYKLNNKGLYYKGKLVKNIKSDRDIYKKLGKPYKPIKKRYID